MGSSRFWVLRHQTCVRITRNMGQFSYVMNLEPGSMGAGLKSMSSGPSVVLSLTGGPGLRELPWHWGVETLVLQ